MSRKKTLLEKTAEAYATSNNMDPKPILAGFKAVLSNVSQGKSFVVESAAERTPEYNLASDNLVLAYSMYASGDHKNALKHVLTAFSSEDSPILIEALNSFNVEADKKSVTASLHNKIENEYIPDPADFKKVDMITDTLGEGEDEAPLNCAPPDVERMVEAVLAKMKKKEDKKKDKKKGTKETIIMQADLEGLPANSVDSGQNDFNEDPTLEEPETIQETYTDIPEDQLNDSVEPGADIGGLSSIRTPAAPVIAGYKTSDIPRHILAEANKIVMKGRNSSASRRQAERFIKEQMA